MEQLVQIGIAELTSCSRSGDRHDARHVSHAFLPCHRMPSVASPANRSLSSPLVAACLPGHTATTLLHHMVNVGSTFHCAGGPNLQCLPLSY